LLGSAEDAARLAQALLDNEGLLTEDSLKLLRPQGDAVQDLPLGWAEFSSGERLWVQHRGGGPGFASIMRLYPEEGLGIVIMANSTNLLSEPVVSALANIDWKSIHSTGDLQ
jgi:CubicO group peptidase (beta-lactamase class C family)